MAASLIVSLCSVAVIVAIINNFIHAKTDASVNRKKKSIVETGTMTLFFFLYYALVRNGISVITISDPILRLVLVFIGALLVILGCVVNIAGRRNLGGNWGNQILIYKDHTLVTDGVYKIVRHPLYASLIWMFFGASLVFTNAAAFLANTFIFLPFMYYRAKQEEEMLCKEFSNYEAYRKKTGMFFPSILRKGP